ncbi:MAG: hypothetical protein IT430_06035 [Phycisphaerales bacterium]|nr:hypothetical protein [Phycisphaerales bacterium]
MKRHMLCFAAVMAIAICAARSGAQSDIESVGSEQRTVGDDANKTYFLINAAPEAPPPPAGYGVLFVLPGSTGSADFNPFVRRIAKFATPEGFLVVQLVAPVWRENPPIVWPTKLAPDAAQQFTTEEFIQAVLDDVRAQRQVDEDRLLLMGWSSSGPVVYAMACQEQTPFDGFYISMSVFHPDAMPPLENAAGRRIAIEHSPQDNRCPFRLAGQARDALTAAGAVVKFETFSGGHGWRGAIYPRMKAAFEFLLEKPAAPDQPEPAEAPDAHPESEPGR